MARYPRIDLSDATVVVTGAAQGIGYATATAFRHEGARVFGLDLDGDLMEKSAIDFGGVGLQADVTDRASFAAAIERVVDAAGGVDVLVNNAGVMPLGPYADIDDTVTRATFDVNVHGMHHGMQLVLPHMVARGRGHIVNVASMAGKIPIKGMAVYNGSKFAAVGLSRAVRVEYAPTGVSVSTIMPAIVRTRLSEGVSHGGVPAVDPGDVARAIVGSVGHRRGQVPVPRALGLWDLVDAVTPEPVVDLVRRVIRDDRILTSIDEAARRDYEAGIAAQGDTSVSERSE